MPMIKAIGIYKYNEKTKEAKIALFSQEEKNIKNSYQLENLEKNTLQDFLKKDDFYIEKKLDREYHFLLKEYNSGIIIALVSKSYIVTEEMRNLSLNIKRVYWAQHPATQRILKTDLANIVSNPQGFIGQNAHFEFNNGLSLSLDNILKHPENFSDEDIRIKQIKENFLKVKEITIENIDKLLIRKEKLDALVEKSQLLSDHSVKFKKTSEDLNKCSC